MAFSHNAFHSTLLGEWNEKKTSSLPPNTLGEKTFPFSCATIFHLRCSLLAALAWPLCQVIFMEIHTLINVTTPFLAEYFVLGGIKPRS